MDILLAKQQVIEVGRSLVEKGLIARTWGNVSCRVDDKSFVITPSGRPYDSLTADDIVEVSIETLKYEGNIKPSSEKGVHAEVYKHFREAMFAIHTHQNNASVISAMGKDIDKVSEEYKDIVGYEIPIAAYGLPGTKRLMQNVAHVLKRSSAKAIIMAHHGALCYGADGREALNNALMLEKECGSCIASVEGINAEGEFFNSRREGKNAVFTPLNGGEEILVNIATGKVEGNSPVSCQAGTHIGIYSSRSDINNIIYSADGHTVKVSAQVKEMRPYLDDFAQIVGASVRCASGADCIRALEGRHAVLIKGEGALCCGINEGDAAAVKMILDKNCKTLLAVEQFKSGVPIGKIDSLLMRKIYLKKYSKQAEENK
ncbi:MAG: class II aldolase/adducin family protein [Clostridiales bacterium]|nr:class II aldolase/adducin family protein [Clostridiales bacterium]